MLKYVIPILTLIIWEVVARYLGFYFLPTASGALVELYNLLTAGPILTDTWISLKRLATASVIAIPGVILISLCIGYFPTAYKLSSLVVNILRSLPASALIPIIILATGITYTSSIVLLAYVIAVPVMVASIDAINTTVQTYRTLIDNLELSVYNAFVKVLIPGSMVGLLSGIDMGITIAFKFLIIVEMFGTSGLGFRIGSSADQMAYASSYALLIWTGIIGMVLFGLLRQSKQRILHWI